MPESQPPLTGSTEEMEAAKNVACIMPQTPGEWFRNAGVRDLNKRCKSAAQRLSIAKTWNDVREVADSLNSLSIDLRTGADRAESAWTGSK